MPEKKKKDKKTEEKVSLLDDLRILLFLLKKTFRYSRMYVPVLAFKSAFRGVEPLLTIVMSKYIIDELTGGRDVSLIIKYVLITIFGNFIFFVLGYTLDKINEMQANLLSYRFDYEVGLKIMQMDYEHVENPSILDMWKKAQEGLRSSGGAGSLLVSLERLLRSVVTIAGVVAVLSGLVLSDREVAATGSALVDFVAQNSIFTITAVTVIVAISFVGERFKRRNTMKWWHEQVPIDRAYEYYNDQIIRDYKAGKDIRLYGMFDMLTERIKGFRDQLLSIWVRQNREWFKYDIVNRIIGNVELLFVYALVSFKVFAGAITLGDFAMYTGAINTFITSTRSIGWFVIDIRFICRYLKIYKDFLELPDIKPRGSLPIKKKESYELRFEDVSFRYPGSGEDMLKNVSITLTPGRRLAVVGMNGAGKTTFIKLLCRLYDPSEGRVLLDGVDIREYDYDEYMDLFAVVFQDFQLFAFTVKENVSSSLEGDDARVRETLRQSGVADRIDEMEQGADTVIYKNFDEKGVEISGGEAQKLAISRALYKNAPVIILDEPTAALDPLAEYEIYSKFDDLVHGRTAVYISHRLSSCRFCDDIAVFHDGRLIQYGSHEELLTHPEGKYAEMWNAQAQYYVDSAT